MKEVLPKLKLKTLKASPNAISSPELGAGRSPCNSPESVEKQDSGRVRLLANRSVLPENSSDSSTQDTSRPSSSNSLASAALQSSLGSKLHRQLENRGCAIYRFTWKEKTTPSGLLYSQLVASVPRTKENDSSLARTNWPTPKARDHHTEGKGQFSPSLAKVSESYAAWPTPQVNMITNSTEVRMSGDGRTTPNKLGWAAALTQPIRVTASGQVLTGSDAEMGSSGQLNPAHSRWLMGFPEEWDDCAVTAMQSYQKSPPNSLPRSWKPQEKRLKVRK